MRALKYVQVRMKERERARGEVSKAKKAASKNMPCKSFNNAYIHSSRNINAKCVKLLA